MVQYHEVVTKQDLLNESYFPSDIMGRDAQIDEISCCLEPANRKSKPMNAWLFGESGTGKTLVAKYVLKKFQEKAFLNGVYINCWENNTFYSILDKLVRELRILGAEKVNIGFKLERICQFIGRKPFIIILDEFDMVRKPESDAVIYNISTLLNIGLICICKSRLSLYSLDDRTLSRLDARQIFFPPYTEKELCAILEKRALFGLRHGTFGKTILEIIAKVAKGNARTAIQTLRNAAYMAERGKDRHIKPQHVRDAHNSSKELKKDYQLSRLNSHQRLLYELVKEKKEIKSGELWNVYFERCKRLNKQPIALRTYSEYMSKLIERELVHWDRALVRGKVRVFTVGD